MDGVECSGLGNELVDSSADIDEELNAKRLEAYFQYLSDYRPGGWHATFRIDNAEALTEGVAAGKGVILWVAHHVFNGLPLKKGMSEAGYSVSHLSRPEHGFSSSSFGVRVLNPLRSHIELRYLRKRVIIRREAEHLALREAHRLLRKGEIVSFTAGAWEGRTIAMVPFGRGTMPIATGPAALAHLSGAALLPVFIVREAGSSSKYRIIIGKPITAEAKQDRAEAETDGATAFVHQLLPIVIAYPGQWRGWKYLQPSS